MKEDIPLYIQFLKLVYILLKGWNQNIYYI